VTASRIIDLATETAAMVIRGADSGDFFNDLPALASGDFNGDGLDDLLIGARFGDGAENSRRDSGETYIVLGRDTLPGELDLASGGADLVIYGGAANDQLGFSGTLADVNGDGLDDALIGAPFALRPDDRAQAGAVYVILGRADPPKAIDLASTPAASTMIGASGNAFLGDSVATTDVNQDGTQDVIIGSTFARRPDNLPNPGAQAGAAYVVFGSESLPPSRDMRKGEYDVVIYGENDDPHSDEFGDLVAGGDLNGDGAGDVIVTAEAADGPDNARSVAAEVHIIYGARDLGGVLDIAAGDQDVTVWGAEQNDTLGFNLAAGDVNGDGVDDLLMSARGGDGPGNGVPEAGEVHVVLGGDLPETIDLAAGEEDVQFYGQDPADMIGYSLGTVDLDGDGTMEVFIGSGFGDGAGNQRGECGEVYVLSAKDLSGAIVVDGAAPDLAVFGALPDDAFGSAMTTGDLNGDGRVELVVLGQRVDGADASKVDAGALYVITP